MTIASEISRLQEAKGCIKASIEAKGVSVGSVTIDNYANCIDSIPTGETYYCVDILVIGGGGNGNGKYGGGGGGGGVLHKTRYLINNKSTSVVVGSAGANSCFGSEIAYAGGRGGSNSENGYAGGSGGGGSVCCKYTGSDYYINNGGNSIGGQGYPGGTSVSGGYSGRIRGGGGGGAGGPGGNGLGGSFGESGGNGGAGYTTNFSGIECTYAGGGGGGGFNGGGVGGAGGGGCGRNGGNGCNATYYGGGGGGGSGNAGGSGYQGIVFVRYPTDGSYGIHSTTGGNTCRTCTIDGICYCIHEFTSNGTFCIIS